MQTFPSGYKAFVGVWEYYKPGYQFKTSARRVMGAIWQRENSPLWYGQRYREDTRIYRFQDRDTAELYVMAADEESRVMIMEKGVDTTTGM